MIFPYRALRKRTIRELACFLLAAAATVALTLSMSEEKLIARAQHKQDLAAAQTEQAAAATPGSAPATFQVVSFESPGIRTLGFIFFAAALAISAMILPGISGSFVLLLLGVYFDILNAINHRQILVLAAFALGALAGLFIFSGILSFLLRKAYNATLSAMIGLMAGSLFALWPFRKILRVGDETLLLRNQWPQTWGMTEWITVGWALIGVLIIFGSLALERKQKTASAN